MASSARRPSASRFALRPPFRELHSAALHGHRRRRLGVARRRSVSRSVRSPTPTTATSLAPTRRPPPRRGPSRPAFASSRSSRPPRPTNCERRSSSLSILVHGGTRPPPPDSRRGHGLRLPRPRTRPLRLLIPGGTRPLRLLVCGDAGVAASTPPSSAVGARASADASVADAASACLSAAGRQPSPDSEVFEIAAGAETKDGFGPVPPDEGRGSGLVQYRTYCTRRTPTNYAPWRTKNQVRRSAPNQAGPSAGHHGRCADCIIRGWFRRAAAVGRAIVPLYFLASSKKGRFLRSFTLNSRTNRGTSEGSETSADEYSTRRIQICVVYFCLGFI